MQIIVLLIVAVIAAWFVQGRLMNKAVHQETKKSAPVTDTDSFKQSSEEALEVQQKANLKYQEEGKIVSEALQE